MWNVVNINEDPLTAELLHQSIADAACSGNAVTASVAYKNISHD